MSLSVESGVVLVVIKRLDPREKTKGAKAYRPLRWFPCPLLTQWVFICSSVKRIKNKYLIKPPPPPLPKETKTKKKNLQHQSRPPRIFILLSNSALAHFPSHLSPLPPLSIKNEASKSKMCDFSNGRKGKLTSGAVERILAVEGEGGGGGILGFWWVRWVGWEWESGGGECLCGVFCGFVGRWGFWTTIYLEVGGLGCWD